MHYAPMHALPLVLAGVRVFPGRKLIHGQAGPGIVNHYKAARRKARSAFIAGLVVEKTDVYCYAERERGNSR